MLTKLVAISPRSSIPNVSFNILDASLEAIQLRNVEGLGPVSANIATTPFGSVDGEAYNGGNLGKRNIVLTFGLNPNWMDQTMAVLRQSLYRYFMPKLPIKLRFTNDHMPEAEISGYVETFEPNIFQRDPEINISVICPEPDFISVSPTVVTGEILDADADPLVPVTIDYVGSIPTGFILTLDQETGEDAFIHPLQVDVVTDEVETFETSRMAVDDEVYFQISTVRGDKRVEMIFKHFNVINNWLSFTANDSVFPELKPGLNQVFVLSDTVGPTWELEYYTRFGGL